jgi:hypothetical protein
MQGSMKTRRRIIETAGCALFAAALLAPSASASPLLSGYGGPGGGNQAILGSALLNGPGSGGGSGAGGPGAAQQSASSALAAPASQPASAGGPSASAHQVHHGAPARRSHEQHGASPAQTAIPANLAYARAERTGAGSGSETLGLSAADFLYAALVLAGLALMGVMTRRLTRASPAKGHG